MNYGFPPSPNDSKLAKELDQMLANLPPDKYGMKPYVEVNHLYKGVRIRRITHYSDELINKIVRTAEETYMKLFPNQ